MSAGADLLRVENLGIAFSIHGGAIQAVKNASFRILPWAPETGWVLCDLYFGDGRPVPFDTRRLLRQALAKLGKAGYEFLAGLEIEFHVFKLIDPRARRQMIRSQNIDHGGDVFLTHRLAAVGQQGMLGSKTHR